MMEGPDDVPLDAAVLPRLRARLALIRSLLDELERHMARGSQRELDLDWIGPVADQLADETRGLSRLLRHPADSERAGPLPDPAQDPVVQ